MLSGEFDRKGQPRLRGGLVIPADEEGMPGDVVGEVTFLVDTGAASSVLMAGDVIDLGIDWNALLISPHT